MQNQRVLARSTAFQPLKTTKIQCPYHRAARCYLLKMVNNEGRLFTHYNRIESRFVSITGKPYFEMLTTSSNNLVDQVNSALGYTTEYICGIQYLEHRYDKYYCVCNGGSREYAQIKLVFKAVYNFLYKNDSSLYILLNTMFVDCLYSDLDCIILPLEMVCIYKEGTAPPINRLLSHFTVPECDESVVSQQIYKNFIVYNTVLTMMLNGPNPFNDRKKPISKIIECLGKCDGGTGDNKKNRIKMCELNLNCEHVMCPPVEMVKIIYHYAKWVQGPNKYAKYYKLMVKNTKKNEDALREWYAFQTNFVNYFFP
uniref:PlxyGVORF115 protein n=1 Tax=Plutella xylostella granulovirus TaxID=98383 RepID=A0A1B2CSM4_9BBAC|nr:PlxyGVORF115 protein [Plutella xylostella granulovirus]